jgi:hypothetical protein
MDSQGLGVRRLSQKEGLARNCFLFSGSEKCGGVFVGKGKNPRKTDFLNACPFSGSKKPKTTCQILAI